MAVLFIYLAVIQSENNNSFFIYGSNDFSSFHSEVIVEYEHFQDLMIGEVIVFSPLLVAYYSPYKVKYKLHIVHSKKHLCLNDR